MSSSGAIKQQDFVFNYSFVKASDPTAFFTGTFASGEVLIHKRTGGTTTAGVNITNLPSQVGSSSVYQITLEGSTGTNETNCDEVIIEFAPATSDFVSENISISFETTASDVLKVQTSTVSGIADFKANVSGLATSAEIAALKDFDPAVDTVANVTTVGTVTDKTGYFISGTKTTLDVLNDVAATDIVSAGPITTLAGAVVNVDTVDVTTTNTDMRGTDGAYTGTPATAGQIADAVWDESYAAHTSAGTFGKLMDIIRKANLSTDGTVAGTPTASAFDTNLTQANDTFNDQLILFVSGSLTGVSAPILDYAQTNGRITFEESLPIAPTASDEFVILPDHVHPITEIQNGLATSAALATVDANVDQILLDTGTDGVVISTSQAQALADEVLKRSVTNTQDSADAHSLAAIVLGILESSRSSTTWTIKKTDGTPFTTKTLTLDSEADPVIGVD